MSNIIDSIQLSGVTYTIQGSGGAASSAITSGDTNAVAGGAVYDKFNEVEQVTAMALNDLNDRIGQGGGGSPTVELTQAEYDALVTAGTVSADTYYIITDAQAVDLTNYYTKSETNTLLGGKADTATTYTKSEIDTALGGKQATLVSGTNIKTINNESLLGSGNIDIQGGGKAIEAGRGISITTGATADTVSFNLPISAGTGIGSIVEGATTASGDFSHSEGWFTTASGDFSHSEGDSTIASGSSSHAEGYGTQASGSYSHAEGTGTQASGNSSHAEGQYTIANNQSEHASGQYNVSSSGSSTFGNSGNTLFSVGNGTADNARHNAFEIRQNGDIYFSYGGVDIILQNKIAELEEVIARALNNLNDRITAIERQLNI